MEFVGLGVDGLGYVGYGTGLGLSVGGGLFPGGVGSTGVGYVGRVEFGDGEGLGEGLGEGELTIGRNRAVSGDSPCLVSVRDGLTITSYFVKLRMYSPFD